MLPKLIKNITTKFGLILQFIKKYKIISIVLSLLLLNTSRVLFISYKIANEKYNSNFVIQDRNGVDLYKNFADDNGYLEYEEEINDNFKNAMIVTEDQSFYENLGIDVKRTISCLIKISLDGEVCGASTITQQLIKVSMKNKDRNIFVKFDEAQISVILNLFLSKDKIFEKYANKIYFGNLRYGVKEAAYGYFGKDVSELDIAEAAFLAGIPNSPSIYDPYTNFENAKKRQEIILAEMYKLGYISEIDYMAAQERELVIKNNFGEINAPHFVNYVNSMLPNDFKEGKIKTTLDMNLYNKAVDIARNNLAEISHLKVTNAAIVVLDSKTGEVLTLVGSVDYFDKEIEGQVNSAIALRNPGSTIKPFVYAYALTKGFTAATLINDKEQIIETFDGKLYFPRNYDRNEHGYVSVREALSNSYNIPAVVTLRELDLNEFNKILSGVGIEEAVEQNADIAVVLGGFGLSLYDLTNAYRVFSNEGDFLGEPVVFANVDGEKDVEKQIFGQNSKEISYVISNILDDEDARRREFGSLSNLSLPFPASIKTGTSTDFKDSWSVGYTPDFVVGVWVGNNDNSEMDGVNGAKGAASILHDLMIELYSYYQLRGENHNFDRPLKIEEMIICSESGLEYNNNCNGFAYEEMFVNGQFPGLRGIVNKVDVVNPNLIEIIDPEEGDEYVFQEGIKVEIDYHANSDFDKIELYVDNSLTDSTQNNGKLRWRISPGNHILQIIGNKDSNEFKSNPRQIVVTLD